MGQHRAGLALAALLGAVAACGRPGADFHAPPPTPISGRALVDRLAVHSGCDETFVARDPESTLVLAVQVPGILERSRAAALPYREVIAIGGPGIVVRLEQGADLDYWCTDVFERPARVDAAWTGVAGVATVTIERRAAAREATDPRPPPSAAGLRLGPAVLAREDRREERLTLPELEIAATLGLPGGG
jgi:hypothetical protein